MVTRCLHERQIVEPRLLPARHRPYPDPWRPQIRGCLAKDRSLRLFIPRHRQQPKSRILRHRLQPLRLDRPRETRVHDVRKTLDQLLGHLDAQVRGVERAPLGFHVLPVLDGGNNRRVRRRSADVFFFAITVCATPNTRL